MSEPNRRSAQRQAIFLSLLCIGLGGIVLKEIEALPVVPSLPRDNLIMPSSAPKSGGAGAFSMPPLKHFAEVLARPLFSSTRRPLPGGNSGGIFASRPKFTVVGIVISKASRDALIEYGHPPRLRHVVEGQDIEGWEVQSIQIDQVVVRRLGVSVSIKTSTQSKQLESRMAR